MPKETMSLCSSGSMTVFKTSRTCCRVMSGITLKFAQKVSPRQLLLLAFGRPYHNAPDIGVGFLRVIKPSVGRVDPVLIFKIGSSTHDSEFSLARSKQIFLL